MAADFWLSWAQMCDELHFNCVHCRRTHTHTQTCSYLENATLWNTICIYYLVHSQSKHVCFILIWSFATFSLCVSLIRFCALTLKQRLHFNLFDLSIPVYRIHTRTHIRSQNHMDLRIELKGHVASPQAERGALPMSPVSLLAHIIPAQKFATLDPASPTLFTIFCLCRDGAKEHVVPPGDFELLKGLVYCVLVFRNGNMKMKMFFYFACTRFNFFWRENVKMQTNIKSEIN